MRKYATNQINRAENSMYSFTQSQRASILAFHSFKNANYSKRYLIILCYAWWPQGYVMHNDHGWFRRRRKTYIVEDMQ